MIDVAKKTNVATAQYMMCKWTEMALREAERRLYNKNPEFGYFSYEWIRTA